MTQSLPYGSWPSPIHSQLLTQKSVRLGEPQLFADHYYWIESRPEEKGRCALMRQHEELSSTATEVLPGNLSVHSKAHEYGGASYLASELGVFYVDAADQRVYRWQDTHTQPLPLTPKGDFRFADFCLDAQRGRLLAVREDHTDKNSGRAKEESNTLVAIDIHGNLNVEVLNQGHDFYSNPRLSPNQQQLTWLCWDHPYMPWDSSICKVADVSPEGKLHNEQTVAGGVGESVFQPQWSPSGELYLVSDRNDWWNIYRVQSQNSQPQLQAVATLQAEFATPQWVFGMSTYGFLSDREILCCYSQNGQWSLALIDLDSGQLNTVETPFCDISDIQCISGKASFIASTTTSSSKLFGFDGESFSTLATSSEQQLDQQYLSQPQAMSFPSGQGGQAHGFFYPPRNGDVSPLSPEQRPPLIVLCHGGPTGATETGLNLKIQYWTSRGFAVMDVNYRGSTGYGRHFREQLNGAWGIHDVEDVCAAVSYLTAQELVAPDKVAIKGSSAGGYTVLAALTFSDTFSAGASLYGIGNLETLATDTHKFESRYLDVLVGPYPQDKEVYQQRSPLHHSEQLNCPVIFFQGLDDKVVPPNQAQAMVDALDSKKVPVAYVPFEGEGHGFRQAANIQRALEAELHFYGQVFGFLVDDNIEPVEVKHLSALRKHR